MMDVQCFYHYVTEKDENGEEVLIRHIGELHLYYWNTVHPSRKSRQSSSQYGLLCESCAKSNGAWLARKEVGVSE